MGSGFDEFGYLRDSRFWETGPGTGHADDSSYLAESIKYRSSETADVIVVFDVVQSIATAADFLELRDQ